MLEFVAFCCGAMIMILEMVGARVMAPYLGSSVIIWTSIIGVMLAFMSLGYWLGGRLADRRPEPVLLCRILLAAGVSVLVMALLQQPMLELISGIKVGLHLAAVGAAIVLFALPSTLLGMSSPFLIRLKFHLFDIKPENSGAIVGRFFALSTLGSILGTFMGGFVLISLVGSSEILFGLAASIFILPVLIWSRSVKFAAAGLGACLVTAFVNFGAIYASQAESGQIDIDTAYGHLRIRPAKDAYGNRLKGLSTDPGFWQSAMYTDAPFNLALPYTKFYDLAFLFAPDAQKILMLGGGAYSVPKHLLSLSSEGKYPVDQWPGSGLRLQELDLDVVEIDPGMTKAARKYFALPEDPQLRVIHQDARYFLNSNKNKKYDLIFGDTFSSCYSIPFQMSTLETVRLIYDQLEPNGIAVVNTIGSIKGDKSKLSKAIAATYAEVFPRVELFATTSPHDPNVLQNVMIMAFKDPDMQMPPMPNLRLLQVFSGSRIQNPELDNAPILRDNFAPVERLVLPLLANQ